ncbi:hypothetical protein [Luteimonas terrae]|uniref:Uncharacterized protein n=1 Tax=Luteimonas terrae TaxID=1530191 RepID=A0A4R5U8Y7_9GAMM|nr:hypothetical protein [Luteimonas terrae]TDK30961.1 hypothetical protein E2F49_11535 [Luteimonas terrae]
MPDLIWRVLVGKKAVVPPSVIDAAHPRLQCIVLHEGDPVVHQEQGVVVEVLVPGSNADFWDWVAPVCNAERLTMALTIASPSEIPSNVKSVLTLPPTDHGQLQTINAVLDLHGDDHLLTGSLDPELKCMRKGAAIEFHDVPAATVEEARDGLQLLVPRYTSMSPVGVIGAVRYSNSLHFQVFDAFGDVFEGPSGPFEAEVHVNIRYEWREALQPGVSVLMVGRSCVDH